MQSTQWNVNFICHTGPRNIHRLWITVPNKLMLDFWSHAFFFSIKKLTTTLKFEQYCNQQKSKNSLLTYMHLWSYASFICTPYKVPTHCLYLLSEWTQYLQHYTFNSHLLHVSAVFGHHQVDFTTCLDENTEVEASPLQLIHLNT